MIPNVWFLLTPIFAVDVIQLTEVGKQQKCFVIPKFETITKIQNKLVQ